MDIGAAVRNELAPMGRVSWSAVKDWPLGFEAVLI